MSRNPDNLNCGFQHQCELCICRECPADCAECSGRSDVFPRGKGCAFDGSTYRIHRYAGCVEKAKNRKPITFNEEEFE